MACLFALFGVELLDLRQDFLVVVDVLVLEATCEEHCVEVLSELDLGLKSERARTQMARPFLIVIGHHLSMQQFLTMARDFLSGIWLIGTFSLCLGFQVSGLWTSIWTSILILIEAFVDLF